MAPTPILQTRPLRHSKEKVLGQSHTPGTKTQIFIYPHSPPAVCPPTIPGHWDGIPTLTQAMTEDQRMFPRNACHTSCLKTQGERWDPGPLPPF